MTKNKFTQSTHPSSSLGSNSATALETVKEAKTIHLSADRLDKLDSTLQKALTLFPVPGFAICIVVDGTVVLSKGYGFRDQENHLPVTENTLFAIGSCSKAFTTFALGQLVDEGLICWDDCVITHLPEFRLKDLHATHHLTIRDLVTHKSGLPRHDLLWYGSKISRAELLSRLQHLEPTCDVREKFQYNNLMYAVAGLLIEKVSGKTWEEFVQSHIFTPLGMTKSNISVEESQKSSDFSLPYAKKNEELQKIPFRNISNVGPAGSINSSIEDMAKWILLHLSDGTVNGSPLINKTTLQEMHVIQTPMKAPAFSSPFESPYLFGYGLGWMTGFHKGHYIVTHGGGIDGFISNVLFLPNEKAGIVILTNSSSSMFASCATYGIVDYLFGVEEETWMDQITEKEKLLKAAFLGKVESQEVKSLHPHPSHEYIGLFEHPGYGIASILLDETKLTASYNDISYLLEHTCHDHFLAAMTLSEQKLGCSFTRNSCGEISEFHISLESSLPPIIFKRKASNELLKFDYLQQFVGSFVGDAFGVEFLLIKDKLTATIAGQTPYELVPEKPLLFSLKGLTGFTLRFVSDAQGKIQEVLAIQPNGTFSLKAK